MKRIIAFLLYWIVAPIFSALFWWDLKVMGVEPKTGQKLYKHDPAKQTDSHIVRRRRGYWYALFGKDEYIKRPTTTYTDMDYTSLYPFIVFSQH